MLVHTGLELSWETRFVDGCEPKSQVALGLLQSRCILQGAVKDFAQALDRSFGHHWNLGPSKGKAEALNILE